MADLRVRLFVVDTGPLITLAAAESLDFLLYPNVQVIIPDAVFYEATRDIGKLGAQEIIDWVRANRDRIELAPTHAYANFEAARSVNPRAYEPNLGERSAVEIIEDPNRLRGEEQAVLLCEETAITRRLILREASRLIDISTMDFLRILESEQRIQSADVIFERVVRAGRYPARHEKLPDHDPAVRDDVVEVLRSSRQPESGG